MLQPRTKIYRKLENGTHFELQRASLQEEIHGSRIRQISAKLCNARVMGLLEGISSDPANQGRHSEAVQGLLLVVAGKNNEGHTWKVRGSSTLPYELRNRQSALKTQSNESQDVDE